MRARPTAWFTMLTIHLATAPLLGCRPAPERASVPPVTVATAAPGSDPAAVMAAARAPAELLPEATGLVVTVASPMHLLRVVDVPALIAKYRPYYEEAGRQVALLAGREPGPDGRDADLLDPLQWPAVGVDPHGPIGAAMLDPASGAWCLFFSLSDPARFREFAERVGNADGGAFGPVFEDHGIVLSRKTGAGLSLVLRDAFAFVVVVERPGQARREFARELAQADPAHGLTATTRWQKALGAATPGDVVGFVDLGGLIRGRLEGERRREEALGPSWAEQELQRLRELGAASEEIGRWEAIADEQRTLEAEVDERRRRVQTLWDAMLGPMGPIVLELSLSGAEIGGTARALVPEPALLRRILAGPGAPPLAMTAASEKVLFGTGARLDVAEALGAVRALLEADGTSLDLLVSEARQQLGVDLATALRAVDGGLSFALTTRDPRALAASGSHMALGFNLALGLKDPAEAEALLEAVAAKLPWKTRRGKPGGHIVSLPQWRELHVTVVGSWLAVSTDPEFARRVEREANGPLERTLQAAVVPVVTTREAAAVLMLDHAALLGMVLARDLESRALLRRDHPMQSQPYWRFPAVSHAAVDAAPQSTSYKARLKEWQRLDAKFRVAAAAEDRRQSEVALTVADSLGAIAVNLRETGDGLATAGGQFFGPGGLARALELAIDGLSQEDAPDDRLYSLREALAEVEQDLQEIRARDIERALGVTQSQ